MKGEERIVEGEYGVKLRKKIWVAAAAVALALTTAVLVLKSAGKREPAIIRELGGVLVAEQGVIESGGMRHLERTYRMATDYEGVRRVMDRNLRLPKWMWFPDIVTKRDEWGTRALLKWRVESEGEAFLFEEGEGPAYVTWRKDPSWLDRQWFNLMKLIGLERHQATE